MSPSEGQVCHATNKDQPGPLVSVASVVLEPGPTDDQARPPALIPPRPRPRVSARVALQVIPTGPQQECRAQFPPTPPEDLDPREAEPDGEQGLWELPASAQGGLCAGHTGRSPRARCWARSQDGSRNQTAIWGPEPREGVLGWVRGLWLLWKTLEWVLGLHSTWKGRHVGDLFSSRSRSSSWALAAHPRCSTWAPRGARCRVRRQDNNRGASRH